MRLGNYLSMLTTPKLEQIKLGLNLSDDEGRIFDLLSKRKSITEISNVVGMSSRTVDRNIRRIKAKILLMNCKD